MRKVSNEFIDEISKRVRRLKSYSGVLNCDILDSLSTNIDMLKEAPVQMEYSPDKSLSDSDFEQLREQYYSLKTRIPLALSAFKETIRIKGIQDECMEQEISLLEQEIHELKGNSDDESSETSTARWDDLTLQISVLQDAVNEVKFKLEERTKTSLEQSESVDIQSRLEVLEKSIVEFRVAHANCFCTIF